jgi:hypothetical protein
MFALVAFSFEIAGGTFRESAEKTRPDIGESCSGEGPGTLAGEARVGK